MALSLCRLLHLCEELSKKKKSIESAKKMFESHYNPDPEAWNEKVSDAQVSNAKATWEAFCELNTPTKETVYKAMKTDHVNNCAKAIAMLSTVEMMRSALNQPRFV